MGEDISDQKVVEKVLISLPEKFESKISSLEDSKDLTTISLAEVIGALEAQEHRRNIRSEGSVEAAFQAKMKLKPSTSKDSKKFADDQSEKNKQPEIGRQTRRKSRFPPCGTCKRTSHHENDCWYKGKTPPPLQCRFCKRTGHIEKYCRQKQQGQQAQPGQQTQQVNFVEKEVKEEHLFMAMTMGRSENQASWFLDSACTQHMTSKAEFFSNLEPVSGSVKMGNGEKVSITGKGTVAIHTSSGTKFISDVLLVPDLDQNLLSVGQMMQKGYSLTFKNNHCVIVDPNGNELADVSMENRSFPLNWN